jgi:hypothetical protein
MIWVKEMSNTVSFEGLSCIQRSIDMYKHLLFLLKAFCVWIQLYIVIENTKTVRMFVHFSVVAEKIQLLL